MSSLQGRELERGVESNKADLEAKSVSEAAKQLGSEAAKCNILISPLEGEKKFLSELCELRNFREGYKKYKTLDRATHNFNLTINYLFHFPCAMTCFLIYPTFVIADSVPRSIVYRNKKISFFLLFPSSKSKISVLPQVEDMSNKYFYTKKLPLSRIRNAHIRSQTTSDLFPRRG